MTSVISNHPLGRSLGVLENSSRGRLYRIPYLGYSALSFPSGGSVLGQGSCFSIDNGTCGRARNCGPVNSSTLDDSAQPDDSEDKNQKDESSTNKPARGNDDLFREGLERIVGTDDSAFSGIDLATLIRNKYGRSYDVQLIKKEFMGRNLLALNVMWKYVEQRSFPLTEEEYILRLDDVANTLKCWGAVSHIRNSLAKLKERPRMGKEAGPTNGSTSEEKKGSDQPKSRCYCSWFLYIRAVRSHNHHQKLHGCMDSWFKFHTILLLMCTPSKVLLF